MLKALGVALAGLAGGVVLGSTGFGSGLVCMGVLPYILHSIPQSALLSGAITIPGNTVLAVKQLKSIDWSVLIPLCLIHGLIYPFVMAFSVTLELRQAALLLGVVMMLLSVFFLCVGDRVKIPKNTGSILVMGILAGFMDGFFNMAGIVMAVYLVNVIGHKDRYYATQAFFIFIYKL